MGAAWPATVETLWRCACTMFPLLGCSLHFMGSLLSRSAAGGLRRRLDTLGVKLFLAIAGANLVLVMAVYLTYSWSFDRGLVDYVNQTEQARLTPMISRLADGYRKNGDWMWLTEDREAWAALLGESLGWRLPRRGWQRSEDSATPASNERRYLPFRVGRPDALEQGSALPPITIDWRVMLFDATQQVLIPYPGGEPGEMDLAVKLPIRVDNRVIGYLGYIPRLRLVRSLESITSVQQSRRFGVIGLGMFAAVLLVAAMISHWLSRRLRALGQGATALARGVYSTRIRAQGHDELARLADDFNHLAQALEAAQRGRQQWIADIARAAHTADVAAGRDRSRAGRRAAAEPGQRRLVCAGSAAAHASGRGPAHTLAVGSGRTDLPQGAGAAGRSARRCAVRGPRRHRCKGVVRGDKSGFLDQRGCRFRPSHAGVR